MSGERETGARPPARRPGGVRGFTGGGRRVRGEAEKAKDFKGTLKRLARYLSPQKYKFLAVFALSVGSTVFTIIGPKIMGLATTRLAHGLAAKAEHAIRLQNAINGGLPSSVIEGIRGEATAAFDFRYVGSILLWLLALYALSSALSFVTGYIMAGVAQKTVYNIRMDIKNKLDRLPLKYFDSRSHGEILSRVTNDMDNIANTLQQSMTQLISSVVSIVGVLVMMLWISPVMTIIAVFTLPMAVLFTFGVVKRSQKFFAAQQKELGELNGHVEEMLSGHKAVKAFNYEAESLAKFGEINERYYEAGWKAQFVSGLTNPAMQFVSNIGYVLVCVVGGVMVARRAIEVGDVQAFIQYMRSFTMPIVHTANIANIIQSTIASAERVFETMDEAEETPERADPVALPETKGHVAFRHVSFGYSPDEPLMTDLSIDIRAGDTVAVVGPTGAGKTTLINLLMRFYEVDGGEITVDGVNIRDMKRSDLRRTFGMVLQDTWLFYGSILDNIWYGNERATKDELYRAAKSARADHFIRALPESYDTVLNEEASNISQGQKQLITIARALLTDPPILILDEATSNVDTRTEVLIQEAMDRLMRGRTCFVIAHRLSTIKNADLILVMNKGAVIEQGSHKQLIAAGGFYSELYNSQFS